jgi:CheY-like chemotaxis protein
MAMRGAERAAVLTRQLLAFARRQPLEPKPIDLNRLVRGMSELLTHTLGESIAIETVLAGGLWWTSADANQLENTVLNLAVNARDAMPNGGRLTIETANTFLDEAYAAANAEATPGQYVMIAVTDTGGGMSPEVISQAFEPFFTTKPSGEGTGLGLASVYGFVKQSGGHVKIYSELGHGTTVKVYLPRLAAGTPEQPTGQAQPAPAGVTGETILVVEDDDDVGEHSRQVLSELGYRVLTAGDAEAALRVLEREPTIRLLFTDVGLPGSLNGRELADEARRRRPALKVLFTTGYARNAIIHQGRLDPGVELLVKPFTYAALAQKIRLVLDS